jgi:ankyrin repeat protein
MMEWKKQIFLIGLGLLMWLSALGLSEETPRPFAADLKAAVFSEASYQSVFFGSLHWKQKGKALKVNPQAQLELVRSGKTEERILLDLDADGAFVVEVVPGSCEIRAVFCEGRWYRLSHAFTVEKGVVCYIGDMVLERKTEQPDHYEYQFKIDTEMNRKKFNQTGSAWSKVIRLMPKELKTQDGQMNLWVPRLAPGLQDIKREEKNLVKAAEQGDAVTVDEFIAVRKGLDSPDSNQRTPLMAALQAQKGDMALKLLSAGAALNQKDKDGWTPLMFALGFSMPDFAKTLIERGVDLTGASISGWTPLHLAARYNQSENARLLLEKGVELNAKTNKGVTALSLTLQYGDEDLALDMLDRGAEINLVETDGWTPLMTALRYEKPRAAKRMLSEGADFTRANQDGWTALMMAIRRNQTELVLDLINRGADGACSDKDGLTPLYLVARYGSMEMLNALLAKKVPVNPLTQEGWTPLHHALRDERGEIALALMANGADLTVKTVSGWTPLHLALRNKQPEAAKRLILKGAGLGDLMPDGWNPLMLALRYDQAENARLLIERKAGIHDKNKDGWSPLMHALRYDQAQNARMLIEKGVDPNSSIPNGWTALHFAIEYGQPENARLLIAKGASKTTMNPDGKTAAELAQAKGYAELVRLLGGISDSPKPAQSAMTAPQAAPQGKPVQGAAWLPGLMGQFVPQRVGATVLSAQVCGPHESLCSAQIEVPGSKKNALEGFKQDLVAAGWRLDQAFGAPTENGSLKSPDLWGILNVIKGPFNITMLFLSDRKTGGKTQVDINLMNRTPGADIAAFVKQIPRVLLSPSVPKERFVSSDWAVTLKEASWCGQEIEKDFGPGMTKYTYRVQGEGLMLLKLKVHLEALDKKPIKDRFIKINPRLRDKEGNLYAPVLAGTSTGDYFNLSQGGAQSALVPMQPESDMDWVFSVPTTKILDALIWPGLETIIFPER